MVRPLSDKEKQLIRHKFNSYCKKVMYHASIDYDRKFNYLAEHEISISELPENIYALSCTDDYFSQTYFFEVSGETIVVKGDEIARSIAALTETQRAIILFYYFMNITDNEIGGRLNMPQRTVQYKRIKTLEKLKEILKKETSYEET